MVWIYVFVTRSLAFLRLVCTHRSLGWYTQLIYFMVSSTSIYALWCDLESLVYHILAKSPLVPHASIPWSYCSWLYPHSPYPKLGITCRLYNKTWHFWCKVVFLSKVLPPRKEANLSSNPIDVASSSNFSHLNNRSFNASNLQGFISLTSSFIL